MGHIYSVSKKNKLGEIEPILKNITKEEAIIKLSELTGYTVSWVTKKYRSLPCLEIRSYCNFRNIIIDLTEE